MLHSTSRLMNEKIDLTKIDYDVDVLVIGGGAKGDVWCQIMADIYEATVHTPVLLEEATSMGAAVTGGVGVGLYRNFDVIDDMIRIEHTYTPDEKRAAQYGAVKEAFEKAYEALLPYYRYAAEAGKN